MLKHAARWSMTAVMATAAWACGTNEQPGPATVAMPSTGAQETSTPPQSSSTSPRPTGAPGSSTGMGMGGPPTAPASSSMPASSTPASGGASSSAPALTATGELPEPPASPSDTSSGGSPGAGGTSGVPSPTLEPPPSAAPADGGAAPVDVDAGSDFFPCDSANPADYDVSVAQSGSTWSVSQEGQEVYSGNDFEQALSSAYAALSPGRSSKESILVQGDGAVSASSQLGIPSYTLLNVCGTIDVTGAASGSDRSPFYARNASHIDIPNLTLTGSPQYGLFFRQTSDIHLGRIELRLTRDAGIGIRVDAGPNAQSTTEFYQNLKIDYVFGTGMGSHIVETYGIDNIEIGSVEGEDVGECGLLLNRSINAVIGSVSCTDCATGTGYAAFRVANSVGKIGDDFPAGNIHVGKVFARGGGRGIFSVSGCGGLVIDEIDIAGTGNTAILLQNTYNTQIAALSGSVSGGVVQLSNDTEDTDGGVYPPTRDVTLQNLTLTDGASVRQDWREDFGSNGCSALNITGGDVNMCP